MTDKISKRQLTSMSPETFSRLDPNGPARTLMRELIEAEMEY